MRGNLPLVCGGTIGLHLRGAIAPVRLRGVSLVCVSEILFAIRHRDGVIGMRKNHLIGIRTNVRNNAVFRIRTTHVAAASPARRDRAGSPRAKPLTSPTPLPASQRARPCQRTEERGGFGRATREQTGASGARRRAGTTQRAGQHSERESTGAGNALRCRACGGCPRCPSGRHRRPTRPCGTPWPGPPRTCGWRGPGTGWWPRRAWRAPWPR